MVLISGKGWNVESHHTDNNQDTESDPDHIYDFFGFFVEQHVCKNECFTIQ